ncbi:MarR family transcriptional regulator [Allorhizobium sp. BGMRC 0089]|uniref:MarR family winged helix-turn-helix transcriptional regulator n=1 Tax=Allorhizobium sonneratiae TaxID=2934936 RepID=UPI00203435C2|nr:MarR family transcriptional regulator [Allorhizobium sonneratiae]MCM2291112.1 MarR family transcriptional regulator [Allorhizobium sonneratiae]
MTDHFHMEDGAGLRGGLPEYSALSQSLGFRVRRAQLAIMQDFNDVLGGMRIKPADFSVLSLIAENSGLKQSDVAAALSIQRANFVAIVDGLENRGLIERRRSEVDRRVYYLHLTDAGHEFLESLLPKWREHEDKFIGRLGGEGKRDELIALLKSIAD